MPSLKLHHGSWFARSRNGGQDVLRLIGCADVISKGQARAILQEWMTTDTYRRAGVLRPRLCGFSDFCDLFLERILPKCSEKNRPNLTCKISVMKRYFFNRPLSMIRADDLEKLIVDLREKGLRSRTINHYLFLMNNLMNRAAEWEYLDRVPWKRVPTLRVRDSRPRVVFTQEHIRLARERLYKSRSPINGFFFDVAIYTGMRTDEIVNLLWTDVDLERRTISVVQKPGWQPKTGDQRTIPIHPALLPVLSKLRELYPDAVSVIPFKRHKNCWDTAFKRAGIPSPHMARHTVATELMMSGGTLEDVKRLLGHKNIATTSNVYIHLTQSHLAETIKLLKY